MNYFQIVALFTLVLLIISELNRRVRSTDRRLGGLVRLALWIFAAYLILKPELTSEIAHRLGIGRGADLVMYASILGGMVAWFNLQTRQVVLERQIVKLARVEAIRCATFKMEKPK